MQNIFKNNFTRIVFTLLLNGAFLLILSSLNRWHFRACGAPEDSLNWLTLELIIFLPSLIVSAIMGSRWMLQKVNKILKKDITTLPAWVMYVLILIITSLITFFLPYIGDIFFVERCVAPEVFWLPAAMYNIPILALGIFLLKILRTKPAR